MKKYKYGNRPVRRWNKQSRKRKQSQKLRGVQKNQTLVSQSSEFIGQVMLNEDKQLNKAKAKNVSDEASPPLEKRILLIEAKLAERKPQRADQKKNSMDRMTVLYYTLAIILAILTIFISIIQVILLLHH
jgi:hypothetical protein